jgi:hypothetical protein
VGGFELLAGSDLAGDVAAEALVALRSLFTATDAPGVAMAVRALGATDDVETIRASMAVLSRELLTAIDGTDENCAEASAHQQPERRARLEPG